MSVVVASQFALKRARRNLERAYQQGNWQAVRQSDVELGNLLSSALDDKSRDTTALVEELENILALYADMVSMLPDHNEVFMAKPKK